MLASRMHALVTGGAGFIGSHLSDALLAAGAQVRILDDLLPQAHPTGEPRFAPKNAEFVRGDVRDRAAVDRALDGIDVVFHLAAMVGNGQSMYDIRRYTDVNVTGTATLVEAIVARGKPLERLVVSSSMVVYGDGAYRCATHGDGVETVRTEERLRAHSWEPICRECGTEVSPIATSESHRQAPTSTYGTSKRAQEELCLVLGRVHSIPTLALRYLNTFGSRQALSNPYTGVAAIMAARVRTGKPPLVFEDGAQLRDFVHVSDVVRANLAAAGAPRAACGAAYNIGTGGSVPIVRIAETIVRELGGAVPPSVTGDFREGDIRHCFADVRAARDALGWSAQTSLEDGFQEFLTWVKTESPDDRTDAANAELRAKGLLR